MTNETTLFDLPNWSVVTITGPERKSYLHSFCTNDINKLAEGAICEAFIPNVKGRILGHVFVLNQADELRLISVPGANQTLVPHLTKYLLGVEAEVTDRTLETTLFAVTGTNAAEALGIDGNSDSSHSSTLKDSGSCLVSPIGLTEQPTFVVSGDPQSIADFKQRLRNDDVCLGSADQFERMRIEAGFPYVGIDITEANLAQEAARTENAISFTKGCYLGQEPIARLDAMGHTNKELRGFKIDSADVSPNAKILAEEKEVGVISSVIKTDDGQSIGLGIIRIKHAKPGNKVAIVTESGTYSAEIYWDHK